MKIFNIINPENKIHKIIAYDKFMAIQTAKRLDNYKYSESQYKLKYTISNLDNEIYKNYSVKQ
jgi:hypothetical protein